MTPIQKIQEKIDYIRNNAQYFQHTEQINVFNFLFLGIASVPVILGICSEPNGWLPEEHLISAKQAEDFYSEPLIIPLLGFYTSLLAMTYFHATKKARLLLSDTDAVLKELSSDGINDEMMEYIEHYIGQAITFIDENKVRERERSNHMRPLLYSAIAHAVNYAHGPKGAIVAGISAVCFETVEAIRDLAVTRKPF